MPTVHTLRIGQGLDIGGKVFVRAEEKSGRYVKLCVATDLKGIHIIADGIVPPGYLRGIKPPNRREIEKQRMAAFA